MTAPRKVFVMVSEEVIQTAASVLHSLGRITSMVPPFGAEQYWKVDIENRDWPPGDYGRATVQIMKSTPTPMRVELVAEITLP